VVAGIALALGFVALIAGTFYVSDLKKNDGGPVREPLVPAALDEVGPPLATVTQSNSQLFKIAFIGDSISAGIGASSRDKSMVPAVINELGAKSDPSVSAIPGANTARLASRISVPSDSSLVIIEAGTDDSGATKTPLNDFREKYATLVSKVRASAPDSTILCLGVWQSAPDANVYDQAIRAECEQSDGTFRILHDIYDGTGTRGPAGRPIFTKGAKSDTVLPNDEGYSRIAARVVEAVRIQQDLTHFP
jgi:lysophospholipase L1-like esterase